MKQKSKREEKIYWGILIAVALGMLNSMIMQTMLSTSITTISAEFNSSISYSWVYSGYVLASTMTMPLFGNICDKFGSKKNFILGYCIFTLGTLLGWQAHSMGILILARVVMGFGSGITVPAIYGIIGEYFEKKAYKLVFAVLALITIVGKGLGSMWGSYFVTHAGWRFGFLSLVPIEVVAIIMVVILVNKPSKVKNNSVLNVRNALLLSLSLCCILFGLDQMDSHRILVLVLIAGIALLLLVVRSEAGRENGAIPYEMKTKPFLRKIMIQVLFMGACINIVVAYLANMLQSALGMTARQSGYCLVIYIIGSGVGSILGAGAKTKEHKSVYLGWGCVVLGCLLCLFTPVLGKGLLYAGLLIFGVGLGILGTVLLSSAVAQADDHKATVSSLTNLVRNVGASIGIAIFGGVLGTSVTGLFAGLLICGVVGVLLNVKRKED